MDRVLFSKTRVDWNTPWLIVDRSVKTLAVIDLDPCSNPASIVPARKAYSLENNEDGLSADWGTGSVYVNPPYGRAIGAWVEKCNQAYARGSRAVIALVPARTDAKWFQTCWTATAICFLRGRLKFLGAASSAPFPSAVIYWGTNKPGFRESFANIGKIITP
jgi:hypothetical protein